MLPERIYQPPVEETTWRKIIVCVLRHILNVLVKIEVITLENMPKEGAVILASNHLSFYDGFVLLYAIPRPIFFMSKVETFRNSFYRFILYQMGAFPVKRGKFDRRSLLHARRILRANQVLGMFPEGTRSYGKGLQSAKTGVAHLALKMNCPIVPVSINGTQFVLKKLFQRAEVCIKICKPIYPSADMKAVDLTQVVMRTLAKNLPYGLRGKYI